MKTGIVRPISIPFPARDRPKKSPTVAKKVKLRILVAAVRRYEEKCPGQISDRGPRRT
jgi:hypothetical protein